MTVVKSSDNWQLLVRWLTARLARFIYHFLTELGQCGWFLSRIDYRKFSALCDIEAGWDNKQRQLERTAELWKMFLIVRDLWAIVEINHRLGNRRVCVTLNNMAQFVQRYHELTQ